MPHSERRPHVVVLSTADFASAVWTNKQHLSVRLAETHDVTYVESLGLRRPALRLSDVRRAAARLWPRRRDAAATDSVPDGVRVISPIVLPWHDVAPARWVNHVLLRLQVGSHLRPDSVLWTFSPVTYGLERRTSATVYHSVDLLHEQPRIARRYVLASERRLVQVATVVVASSSGVVTTSKGSAATTSTSGRTSPTSSSLSRPPTPAQAGAVRWQPHAREGSTSAF